MDKQDSTALLSDAHTVNTHQNGAPSPMSPQGAEETPFRSLKGQLQQTEHLLRRSQAQLHETESVLEQCYARLQNALRHIKTLEADKQILQKQLLTAQKALESADAQSDSLVGNLEAGIETEPATATQCNRLNQYHQAVKEAWRAYSRNDIPRAIANLEQAYQYSPYARSQTVMDSVRLFTIYAQQSGSVFDVQALVTLKDWQRLMSNFILGL